MLCQPKLTAFRRILFTDETIHTNTNTVDHMLTTVHDIDTLKKSQTDRAHGNDVIQRGRARL